MLQIASEIGIDAAETRDLVFDVGGTHINALLSTRFDRDIEIAEGAGTIRRRHAEDFCQALGLPPSLKYERDAVDPHRRFSAAAVNVIAAQTTVPALVTRDFLAQTIFNLLVGNTDNHGKNTSLLYRGRTVLLAPLYDVAPVFMDRRVTHEFAFRHGSARFAEDFDVDALRGLLSDLGFGKPPVERAMKQIQQLAKRISELSARHAPKGLVDGLHAQARVLEDALDVDFGLEERDYYDRVVRDEAIEGSGWMGYVKLTIAPRAAHFIGPGASASALAPTSERLPTAGCLRRIERGFSDVKRNSARKALSYGYLIAASRRRRRLSRPGLP